MPLGEPTGNLTLGRGTLNGVPVHIALVENKAASGSIGAKECDKLASLFRIITAQKTPLLLYLDCAGARVSEGLPALGAFRQMYRAALEMAISDAPITVLLGTHCYGGASMLAALADLRVFSSSTHLAMSGPSILAAAAGASALDDAFRAIAEAGIGAAARAKLSPLNVLNWDCEVVPNEKNWYRQHQMLGAHPVVRSALAVVKEEPVQRKDLTSLYPLGYQGFETTNVFFGQAKDANGEIHLLGIVDKRLLGAARAWVLADRVWSLVKQAPTRLHVLVDCETHSAQLDDERAMLSCYLADLAFALMSLAKVGTVIETTVLGRVGALAVAAGQLDA